MLPSTVAPIEILWTMPAVIGLLRYTHRWRIYWCERLRQRERERLSTTPEARARADIDGDMADIRCIRFAFLAFSFWVFLWIGIIAMTRPQAPVDADSIVIAGLLIAGQVSLIVKGEVLDEKENRLYRKVSALLSTRSVER